MATPTLADWQVNIGGAAGVTMGRGTPYLIHDFAFFGQSNHRTLDTPRGNRSGDFTSKDYFGSRVGTIKVTVTGTTPTDAMNNYNALVGQWWVRDTETLRPLQFKLPGQPQQQMLGKPRRFNPDMSRLLASLITVDLEYYNPDPAIVAADLSTLAGGLPSSFPGRTYPRVYPLVYGAGTAAPVTVTNAGNYKTRPVVTVYGPCTNPLVENITQGKMVKINIDLAAGDFLVLDMDAHSILLNGTASRRNLMSTNSQWWDLDPGVTAIQFLADTYQPAASVTVAFYSAWLG